MKPGKGGAMIKKEFYEAKIGTHVYNGIVDGIIKVDECGDKVIEIQIPIYAMYNDHYDRNFHPEDWYKV